MNPTPNPNLLRGRPPLKPEERRKQISISLPPALLAKARRKASADLRPLSGMVEEALVRWMEGEKP